MKKLRKGNLDFHSKKDSRAKNTLWELELWSILRKSGFSAKLEDPPDMVVNLDSTRVGIACKNLYSEKHVQNVLLEGVSQINNQGLGIVALNLDAILAENPFLNLDDQEQLQIDLTDFNKSFMERHKRHLKKYLRTGRLISVLVFTAHFRIPGAHLNQQGNLWTILDGLPIDHQNLVQEFKRQLTT